MSMARILVVDDEPFNLDIVAEYLDEMDFDLVMVESGEAAWDELTRPDSSFDLVLLDRMMPGMDGIQVLKKIKGDAELRGIPVIMQTAATSPEQVREGLAAGAFYYLTKPFEGEALQTIIRSALDDMRTRRELNANLADHAVALSCITEGEFFVRTLDEARKLAAFIALLGPQPETLAMGLSELLVNGVEHGNLGIDFAVSSCRKTGTRKCICGCTGKSSAGCSRSPTTGRASTGVASSISIPSGPSRRTDAALRSRASCRFRP